MTNKFGRQILISAGIIVLGFAAAALAIYWLGNDLDAEATQVSNDQAVIKGQVAELAVLAELKEVAPEAAIYKQAMDSVLPTQDQLLEFPHWLQDLARVRRLGLNFNFQGSQVSPAENNPGFVNFNLDLTGNINDLTNFLKDLEYSAPGFIVVLDNVDLSKADSDYRIFAQGRVFFR